MMVSRTPGTREHHSNAIWEEFELSFLAIAPLGALYSLLVLCAERGPRIRISKCATQI